METLWQTRGGEKVQHGGKRHVGLLVVRLAVSKLTVMLWQTGTWKQHLCKQATMSRWKIQDKLLFQCLRWMVNAVQKYIWRIYQSIGNTVLLGIQDARCQKQYMSGISTCTSKLRPEFGIICGWQANMCKICPCSQYNFHPLVYKASLVSDRLRLWSKE